MEILSLIEAAIKLGAPMIVLSWLIFTWLYGGGQLDREADRKSINAAVKKMKKSFKRKKGGGKADYMMGKWMWFGSGFYGLAGLWTFVVIEVLDFFRLLFNPSRVSEAFADGFIAAAIDLLTNQFSNIVMAFLWFGYWSDDNVLLWLLVAYFGYWIGIELARRGDDLPFLAQLQEWLKRLKLPGA